MLTSTMSPAEAKNYRLLHDAEVKRLSRMTRPQLLEANRAAMAELGMSRVYGQLSKDELIRDTLSHRYPVERLNESIHVLYHDGGLTNSACEWCAS